MDNGLLRTGDSIEGIVETYSDMVYKLALSRTRSESHADDVFQEVFMRYMGYIMKNKGFESDVHLKAWLIRVTINCSHNIFNSFWFRNTVELREEISFETQEKRDVYFAVQELPIKYRTVLHLFYYEDMSIKEMSYALSLSEGTIKSQLSRGRELLKNKLKEEYDYV